MPLVRGTTLLEATLGRLGRLAPPKRRWVVASRELARPVRAALRAHPGVHALLEPESRNTAAAIAWAAACVAGQGAPCVLAVLPADHHIPEAGRFASTLRSAARAALATDDVVLVGVEPTRPDTAYGYLKVGRPDRSGTSRVLRFEEKPPLARARRFAASGQHLWNAGMIVARPERVLAETREHGPEVWRALGGALEVIAGGGRVSAAALARAYRRVRPISFDYAVLERSRRVRALRARFAWSDLGSWDALAEHLEPIGGNRVKGTPPLVAIDSRDNVIWNTTGRPLALLGVQGLVVVEAPDALLICSATRAQDVRRVVDELVRRRRGDLA